MKKFALITRFSYYSGPDPDDVDPEDNPGDPPSDTDRFGGTMIEIEPGEDGTS